MKKREFLPPLTGLRGVAALWVVAFHSRDFIPTGSWPILKMGDIGVDVFFVLSGFIISYVHWGDFPRLVGGQMRRFLWARLSRIYPVHFVTLLAAFAYFLLLRLSGAPTDIHRFSPGSFIGNLLLTHAWTSRGLSWNVVSWSISAEWAAYLTFPFLAVAIRRLRSPAACLAGAMASLALMIAVHWLAGGDWNVPLFPIVRVAGEFTCGCFLYAAYRNGALADLVWGSITDLAALVLIIQTAAELYYWVPPTIAIFILGLAFGRGIAARLLSTRFALLLGDVSYSLYMVHFLAMEITFAPLRLSRFADYQGPWRIALYALSVLLIALFTWLMFRFVEKPARNRMRRLFDTRPPTVEPYAALSRTE